MLVVFQFQALAPAAGASVTIVRLTRGSSRKLEWVKAPTTTFVFFMDGEVSVKCLLKTWEQAEADER